MSDLLRQKHQKKTQKNVSFGTDKDDVLCEPTDWVLVSSYKTIKFALNVKKSSKIPT